MVMFHGMIANSRLISAPHLLPPTLSTFSIDPRVNEQQGLILEADREREERGGGGGSRCALQVRISLSYGIFVFHHM